MKKHITVLLSIVLITIFLLASCVEIESSSDKKTNEYSTKVEELDSYICSISPSFDYSEYKKCILTGGSLYRLDKSKWYPELGSIKDQNDYGYIKDEYDKLLQKMYFPAELFFPGFLGNIDGEVVVSRINQGFSYAIAFMNSDSTNIKYPEMKNIVISISVANQSIEDYIELNKYIENKWCLLAVNESEFSNKDNFIYPISYIKKQINGTDIYIRYASPNSRKILFDADLSKIDFNRFIPDDSFFKIGNYIIGISYDVKDKTDFEFGIEMPTRTDYEAAMKLITDENYISAVIDNIREYLKSKEN